MYDEEPLYRINDVLTSLAHEMGVNVTPKWEDDVLDDLTHTVAAAFGLDDKEEDVRGCSCGMADYGAPGHDGHDEEGDDDGHQPEGP